MAIDVASVSSGLRSFVRSHNAQFQKLSARQSQLLEIGALMIAAKHYELAGYSVVLRNPRGNKLRVKLTSTGHPWNFSRFEVTHGRKTFEVHSNLAVADTHSTRGARYVVDVAVAKSGSVPKAAPGRGRPKWRELKNADLVTFIEAKALVVYPMLIAQFIGIVHELKPEFLLGSRPRRFLDESHFDPALVSLGYLHGTCAYIVRGLESRRCHIAIVPEFDLAIANLKFGTDTSALAQGTQARARGGE